MILNLICMIDFIIAVVNVSNIFQHEYCKSYHALLSSVTVRRFYADQGLGKGYAKAVLFKKKNNLIAYISGNLKGFSIGYWLTEARWRIYTSVN